MPLKVTVDDERNPVPLMVSGCGAAPTVKDGGNSAVTVGTGLVRAVTAIEAVPNLVVSCVEVAVIVAVPVPLGVNIPADVIVPPVADHVTAEL
jgi:hypothetical protein